MPMEIYTTVIALVTLALLTNLFGEIEHVLAQPDRSFKAGVLSLEIQCSSKVWLETFKVL